MVRAPASSRIGIRSGSLVYAGSARMSAIWAGFLVAATRPIVVPGFTRVIVSRRRASANAGGAPCRATNRNASPSVRNSVPNFASQMRTAFASRASNTGFNSPGELEMTFSTSEVAVCCSSVSFSLCSSSAILSVVSTAGGSRPAFDALRRFNVLGRCVFAVLPPVLPRRLIASPEAQDRASYRLKPAN